MKIFQKALMASEDVKAFLVSGKFFKNDAEAEIEDGSVVAIGDLVENTAYTSRKDHNIRKVTAPAAATDEIGFVDLAEVSQGDIMGNVYKIGYKTAGLKAPAGLPVRVRRPIEGDLFYLGADNFDKAPEIGDLGVVTAGATTLTVTDEAPNAGIYVVVEDIESLTQGTVANDYIYFCRVKKA